MSLKTGQKDKFGRDICVGQIVVYPVRRASSIYLNDAKITGAIGNYLSAVNTDGVQVKLRYPNRCAIVEV